MLKKILLSLAALLAVAAVMQAQELPYDPELRKGVLENGMTYYIRHNGKPEGQAVMRAEQSFAEQSLKNRVN